MAGSSWLWLEQEVWQAWFVACGHALHWLAEFKDAIARTLQLSMKVPCCDVWGCDRVILFDVEEARVFVLVFVCIRYMVPKLVFFFLILQCLRLQEDQIDQSMINLCFRYVCALLLFAYLDAHLVLVILLLFCLFTFDCLVFVD